MSKTAKSKNKIKVNFTGVETRARLEDGQYHARVVETSVEDGEKASYIKWTFEVISDDKTNGRKLYYNTSLSATALWNLRNLLETLGVEVPDSETSLDLDGYTGLELMVRVENEVWEGKERPKVTDFTPVEEATTVKDDAKDTDPDAEEEEEEKEGDDAEDDDVEEEEEAPAKMTEAEIAELDDGELADLVKRHSLGVDLKKITKRSKRLAAVVDAMEKADLLGE